MWIVLIYLHWLKCFREETLLFIPRMLAKVLAAPPFFVPLSITPSILESLVTQHSVLEQDVSEDNWRRESPAGICRRPNYSPVTVLASTGPHPEHCSSPGGFWSSVSVV